MKKSKIVALLLSVSAILILICCGTPPQVNVVRTQAPLTSSIKTIALMPSGGVLADAIGIELLSYGFNIVDTGKVTSLMVRANLNEIEIIQPQNISRLHYDGIDAVILVKSVAGYDGRPQSSTVKIVNTTNGQLVAGANWQNGRDGRQGADADARVGLAVAARQIAGAIGQALKDR